MQKCSRKTDQSYVEYPYFNEGISQIIGVGTEFFMFEVILFMICDLDLVNK